MTANPASEIPAEHDQLCSDDWICVRMHTPMIVPVDSLLSSSLFFGAGEAVIEGTSEVTECLVPVEVEVDSVVVLVDVLSLSSVVEESVFELLVSLDLSDSVIEEISVVSVRLDEGVEEVLGDSVLVVEDRVAVLLVVLESSTLSEMEDKGDGSEVSVTVLLLVTVEVLSEDSGSFEAVLPALLDGSSDGFVSSGDRLGVDPGLSESSRDIPDILVC